MFNLIPFRIFTAKYYKTTMKKHTLLLFSLCIPMIMHALTVTSTAGGLSSAITTAGATLSSVTNLTVTGNIDARDFKTMRDNMPALTTIELSSSSIMEYTGAEGTFTSFAISYEANTIPHSALQNKSGLLSITIPTPTTAISMNAFENCTSLTAFTTPSLVTSISSYAFKGCTNLNTINIPSNMVSIGSESFKDCTSLASISIPASTTNIGGTAFSGSSAYINIDASNPKYFSADGVLFSNIGSLLHCPTSKTGSYTIPSTVSSVSIDAFRNCVSLSSITIPSGVREFYMYAFEGCTGLTSISIPASVLFIDSYTFADCSNLATINAYATTPFNFTSSSSGYVFSNVNKTTCVLHVPVGSKAAYQAASQWKDFTNIVEDLSVASKNPSVKKINASIQNGKAIISGLSGTEQISIYNTQGSALYNQVANSETVIVNLPSHGIYIIRVGNESIKVVY